MKVYFAHAMTDYGNDRERLALAAIETFIKSNDGVEIINPNEPVHSDAADAFKRAKMNAMDYFCAMVRDADALVFLAMPDDNVGPGVAKEIIEASCWGKPIFEVFVHSKPRLVEHVNASSVFNGRRIIDIATMRERIVKQREDEEIPF